MTPDCRRVAKESAIHTGFKRMRTGDHTLVLLAVEISGFFECNSSFWAASATCVPE